MEVYALERKLGQGSMGSVHLARRRSDGHLVALKAVAVCSVKEREQAANEVQILRSLRHGNIVRLLDSFVHLDEVVLAMQYCPDGDLAELIALQRKRCGRDCLPCPLCRHRRSRRITFHRRHPLPACSQPLPHIARPRSASTHPAVRSSRLAPQTIRAFTCQLASALAHVHSLHIVHRDIKASNVFLAPDARAGACGRGAAADGTMVLLGDFGVAKALESTRAMACTQCGTPYYLPPEVCNGSTYNTRADMWSLGASPSPCRSTPLPCRRRFGIHSSPRSDPPTSIRETDVPSPISHLNAQTSIVTSYIRRAAV